MDVSVAVEEVDSLNLHKSVSGLLEAMNYQLVAWGEAY